MGINSVSDIMLRNSYSPERSAIQCMILPCKILGDTRTDVTWAGLTGEHLPRRVICCYTTFMS